MNERTYRVLLLVAVGDTGMVGSRRVSTWKISVVGNKDAVLSRRKR